MNTIEIHFSTRGNTVIGSYTDYLPLDSAIAKKLASNRDIMFPQGMIVKGEKADIARLAEMVLTFGNCLKSKLAWVNACKLAGVSCKF
jgi:hypothetical protein